MYNEPGWLSYASLFVLLSLTLNRHRPSNCTITLPVLEGCGALGVAMLTAVIRVVGVAVSTAVAGVAGVALVGTVAGTNRNIHVI